MPRASCASWGGPVVPPTPPARPPRSRRAAINRGRDRLRAGRRRSTASASLEENIEDEEHNTTRFLVMSREPRPPPNDGGLIITTFIFRVRNVPAALYKALGGFATNGVNMTKLESYMVGGTLHRDPILCRRRGPPRRPALAARPGGTAILLPRGANPRRLSRPSLPPRWRAPEPTTEAVETGPGGRHFAPRAPGQSAATQRKNWVCSAYGVFARAPSPAKAEGGVRHGGASSLYANYRNYNL